MSRALLRSTVAICALALVVGVAPRSASADPSQLCRSITTVALAPTDILFGPYIAATTEYWGLVDQDDGPIFKTILAVPGFAFLNALQAGGAVIRVIAGIFEFVPGLFTFFSDNSPDALYTSQDETEAVYSTELGPCPIRIGSNYNTINQ